MRRIPQPITVTPGQRVRIHVSHSEVCMSMGVTGRIMEAEITTGPYPLAQLYRDGRPFSAPILIGEAGFYRNQDGTFYAYPEPL